MLLHIHSSRLVGWRPGGKISVYINQHDYLCRFFFHFLLGMTSKKNSAMLLSRNAHRLQNHESCKDCFFWGGAGGGIHYPQVLTPATTLSFNAHVGFSFAALFAHPLVSSTPDCSHAIYFACSLSPTLPHKCGSFPQKSF